MRTPALLMAALCATTIGVAEEGPAFPESIRGITVSTHGGGRDWGSDAMRPTLESLRELGAGWVAIHPYARIDGDGTVRFRREGDAALPRHVTRPIEEAHGLGLKILIKPHLAYWGSPFEWRGAIGFGENEEAWKRFWSGYRAWIVELARVAREADGFVVGTELDRTIEHHAEWSEIIRAVRAVTDVPLTYAANWDRFEAVPFWRELDAVGVQAYFPLVEEGQPVDESTIRAGWRRWSQRLLALSARVERPVLFTELGYNHSFRTATEPWSHATDEGAEPLQALCTRIALGVVEREPAILGAFLWKWFPEPRPVGRNYRLATPMMRDVIREAWVASSSE